MPQVTSPLYDTFNRAPIAFARGEGSWLETTDGRRMLDFSGGIAVTALGHAHPALVAVLTEQAGKLWHTSNLYRVPGQERLARRLIEVSFADTVFFTTSGAEAVQCALNMARRYHFGLVSPERLRRIPFVGAFPGRPRATLPRGRTAHPPGCHDPVRGR